MLKELGVIRIASPCRERWAQMKGDDLVRHCDRCHHNVYDLSKLDSTDARALLLAREGKLCVRFWARADGTVITKDCPIGARWKTWHWAAAAIIVINFVAAAVMKLLAHAPDSELPNKPTPAPAPLVKPAYKLKGFGTPNTTPY